MLDAGYWILDKTMLTSFSREARISYRVSSIQYPVSFGTGDGRIELVVVRYRLTDIDIYR
jgi:hypothetical protein